MGLTDDQKAMLRLLAQREEGYEDMAALMGISVDELRKRVREALVEVDQARTDAPPPSPEPAATPKAPAPEPPEVEQPTPPLPEPEAPTAPAAPKPVASRRRHPRVSGLKLPEDRGARIGLAAGALALVGLAVILILSGGEGGNDDSTSSAADGGTIEAAAENPNLTQAILSSVDGGDVAGRALFGRFRKNILLQVEAEGLEPTPDGSSYAVWLSRGGKPVVPVGTGKVDDSGQLVGRFPLPEAVLVLVAQNALDTIDVTLASDSELSAAIARTRRTAKAPNYTGEPVLRGEVTGPLVGAAAQGGR